MWAAVCEAEGRLRNSPPPSADSRERATEQSYSHTPPLSHGRGYPGTWPTTCTSPALSQISPHARTECFAADCLERRGPASAEHLPETTSETRPEVEGGACANPPPPAASAGEGASREECGAPGALPAQGAVGASSRIRALMIASMM